MEACLITESDFVWRGPSELLVAQPGARAVVEELRRAGRDVIGMDGFNLESDGLLPRLDLIYDPGLGGRTDDAAAAVVNGWPHDVHETLRFLSASGCADTSVDWQPVARIVHDTAV